MLAEPLWTDPGLRSGISVRDLISTSKRTEKRTRRKSQHHHQELPQWGAADAEIKVPSDENTELKRVGQYIAIHAALTARDFFLAYFYPSGPFTCICFSKSLLIASVLAMANTWFLCRPAE